jgi:hypothetical protein
VQIPRWWNFCDILDLEVVHHDAMLGNDEPKEASSGDTKYALDGDQVDIILATPLK